MLALAAGALAIAAPLAAMTEPVAVPSGLSVQYHDFLQDALDGGLTYRFRFVAPGIADADAPLAAIFDDMTHLCDTYAVPRLSTIGPEPKRIVITLMSEPVEFGVPSPEITQFFESYTLRDGACIWEAF